MSLTTPHATLVLRKQSIKSALHDAATSLGIDPHDEVESDYEYAMLFTSKRQAEQVADYALYELTDAVRSVVAKEGNLYSAKLLF